MVIEMNEMQVRTLAQVRAVLQGTEALQFEPPEDNAGRYGLGLEVQTHTTRRLRLSPLQRLERDHLAHTQLQRIGHRLQALN